jgi:uracil-DNA glycosylase
METLTPAEIEFPRIITQRRIVPNEFPIIEPTNLRIALVGEAPGEDEENHRRPFVGKSGNLLTNMLRDVGIDRAQVFLGNVCQVRPPGNRIEAFAWGGSEIQEGLAQLNEDLTKFNPNVSVLLGNTPLHAAKRDKSKITEWRGSLFQCCLVDSPFFGRKCLPTLHPAFVLREWSGFPLLKFDLKRARDEAATPDLFLPQRELITHYDASTLCYIMDTWPTGQRCSLDIEGGLGGWSCVSLSARPSKGFTIAWGKFNHTDHGRVLQAFARLMYRDDVPKVLQNSLYDNFVLSFGFGIPIRNVAEDTMLKGWEIYCELPKALGVQASIWTREPFYKFERKTDEPETLYKYCAKDSTVTLEICNNQDNVLLGRGLEHYRTNVEMLNPLLYMELRGIKYDQEKVKQKLAARRREIENVGEALNEIAGTELRGPKGSLVPQRLVKFMYDGNRYPKQFKKEHGRKTDKLTTDVEALLTLRRKCKDDKFLSLVLKHRHLESIIETLNIKPDSDGRVRCGYNVVGTETGRLTCYTSPTGSGANLQTITENERENYVADEGYDMGQCDLAGADGWTVACRIASLGDRTMLDDLLYGLKIAKIVVLLYDLGAEINQLDRESLANLMRVVDKKDWRYFACKRVQHSTNYLVGVPTICTQVMKDSYKKSGEPIYLEQSQGRAFQDSYKLRYRGVSLYHNWGNSVIVSGGNLTSASGHTRIFFGRRFGQGVDDTVKELLADEPQQNTTYATNSAALKLWNDPENRRSGKVLRDAYDTYIATRDRTEGGLFIEPLHQIHDALLTQWPTEMREWARKRHHYYFQNEMTIANIPITIPFEGRFGRSWGELDAEL